MQATRKPSSQATSLPSRQTDRQRASEPLRTGRAFSARRAQLTTVCHPHVRLCILAYDGSRLFPLASLAVARLILTNNVHDRLAPACLLAWKLCTRMLDITRSTCLNGFELRALTA